MQLTCIGMQFREYNQNRWRMCSMAECHMGNIYRYLCIIEISSEISGKKTYVFLSSMWLPPTPCGGEGMWELDAAKIVAPFVPLHVWSAKI